MTEFVHVGRHADILQSGRGIAPGERVQAVDLGPEDQYLVEDGILADIKSFDGPSNSPSEKDAPVIAPSVTTPSTLAPALEPPAAAAAPATDEAHPGEEG